MTEGVRRERGQGTVEMALLMPVVLIMMLMVVQVGLVINDQVKTTHAAREAARVVAVTGNPDAAASAAASASNLDPERLSVEVQGESISGTPITVVVSYEAPTDVPLIGPTINAVTLKAEATMLVE